MSFKRLMKIIKKKKTEGKTNNQSYNANPPDYNNNYLTLNISNKL